MKLKNIWNSEKKTGLSTAPVFFTAISTILGAILFLRFGFAVGTLGCLGVFLIIIVGHLVTIPTSLAISEIATNHRVEGGGEYFIISRSFGLNIGATIGIALFLSQAISVAFYVIAFTEAFEPLFNWVKSNYDLELPRQVVSVPAMLALSVVIIKKGTKIGIAMLYVVVSILAISLIFFFLGSTEYSTTVEFSFFKNAFKNGKEFFVVFAIVFPAFTGMTAGVGLSGDLRNPKKSIPIGTISATFAGMIIYFFIIWKLSVSASPEDLISNQLIMSKIALFGFIVIPLGLAASTISSAIGSVLVAPRTLQAICTDNSFPIKRFNRFFSKGVGELNEPYNATVLTSIIALAFVIMGDVNAVAEIISMFFMVTYGSLCLISFLHHFGADPSYRPSFKSKWYISMLGFLMCVYLMFQINTPYAIVAIVIMMILYIYLSNHHKDRNGLEAIFQGAIFQLSRKFQVFLQKKKKADLSKNWRPSAVCVSKDSFERDKAFNLLNWISYKYGFGTYIHLIDGYYSKSTNQESRKILQQLIDRHNVGKYNVYIDTLISPSYTSAIAQIAQLPSPSGMENNMIVFEFDKHNPKNLKQVIENIALVQSGDFDILILGNSSRIINFKKGIHIWIRELTQKNANLIILLSYIFLSHPDWSKGFIKLFSVCKEEKVPEIIEQLNELVLSGRLQITKKNIDIIIKDEDISLKSIVNEYSKDAGLTIIGFSEELLKHTGEELFLGYDQVGDILFVEAASSKTIDYG